MAVAEEFGYEMAKQGALVVSGMARGIDAAAQRGALRAGGLTAGGARGGGGGPCRSAAEHRIRLDQPGIVPSRTVPVIQDTHIRSSDSEQSRIAKQYIDSPYEAADRTHPNPRDTDLSRR